MRNYSESLVKIRNHPLLNTKTVESSDKLKVLLTGAQIEQYKRQLYDLIKQRRDPDQINQLNRFLLESCEPNLHLFNVALKAQLMLKNVEGIKEILLLIVKNKMTFNAVTLNLLLVYYRDLDMMEEAEKLFEAMKARNDGAGTENSMINCASPNLSAFTTMIAGWARRGNYEKAKKYYELISANGNDLIPDEQAKCALLNAAICTGNLQDVKPIFDSIEGEKGFVASKLWLRATLRLGGYETSLIELLKYKECDSLELSEFIKWIRTDLKAERSDEEAKALIYFIKTCLKFQIRIGDPQSLHSALDSLKQDPKNLKNLVDLSLRWPENLLPIIGTRLLHQLLSKGLQESSGKILKECENLRVRIPNGLLIDFHEMVKK